MLSFIRVLPTLRSVELNIKLFFPVLAIDLDTWIQETAFKYAQIIAPASASLRRIMLCANDVVVPFTVERDTGGMVVSVLQLPVKMKNK